MCINKFMGFFRNNFFWVSIVILVVALDRGSKILVIQHLPFEEPYPVLPILNLLFTFNAGAAFSFLQGAGGWQEWMFGIIAASVSLFLIIWLLKLKTTHSWLRMALALILGGTIGNLYDRIFFHRVIDFIDFYWQTYHFATFNLADAAICVGATMLVIDVATKGKIFN